MEIFNLKKSFTLFNPFNFLWFFSFLILIGLACQPQVIHQEARIVAPRILDRPVLHYPQTAKYLNQFGEVEILVLVNVSGKVLNARISKSSNHEILDQAALDYVKEVSFVPGKINDKSVAMWMSMNIQFSQQKYLAHVEPETPGWAFYANVSNEEMQQVFDFLKTPYDQGVVLRASDNKQSVAHPKVFRYQDQWFMSFVLEDHQTLETWLTSSKDLTSWQRGKAVLPKTMDSWDATVKMGAVSLVNPDLNSEPSPVSFNGSYWMIYLGSNNTISTHPSSGIGAAYASGFDLESSWKRLDAPVLNIDPNQFPDWRKETGHCFTLFHDKQFATGYPFILLTYLVDDVVLLGSNDLRAWYQIKGQKVSLKLPDKITDLEMMRLNDLYVLVYTAYNKTMQKEVRFACSKNLFYWQIWDGEPLLNHTKDIRESCLFNYGDTVYHFYTLKENGNTSIALSTSKPIK